MSRARGYLLQEIKNVRCWEPRCRDASEDRSIFCWEFLDFLTWCPLSRDLQLNYGIWHCFQNWSLSLYLKTMCLLRFWWNYSHCKLGPGLSYSNKWIPSISFNLKSTTSLTSSNIWWSMLHLFLHLFNESEYYKRSR